MRAVAALTDHADEYGSAASNGRPCTQRRAGECAAVHRCNREHLPATLMRAQHTQSLNGLHKVCQTLPFHMLVQRAPSGEGTQQQTGGKAPETQQAPQSGGDLATSAAKLVAEIVASPIFYLVAGSDLRIHS